MDTKTDTYFMSLALDLAEKGRGLTSPNPMVGAVIVRDGEIIGKGYHHKAGDDHAEIIALREAGTKAHGAILYVTLEPCCHFGKTPPCSEAILKSGIRRVVAAMIDVNPLVCGVGLKSLQQNNIETIHGIMETRAKRLNEAYIKYITTKTPFVTLKLAVTLDGKIADVNGKSKWITGSETRKWVHKLRSWSDAIMVGIGTVLADDPLLTVRNDSGSNPLRIIVDSQLSTPENARVLADKNVIIATTSLADNKKSAVFNDRGIEILKLDSSDKRVSLSRLIKELGEREIVSVLCEGGGTLAASLLNKRLVDKVVFTIAPKIMGEGFNALNGLHSNSLDNAILLKDSEVDTIGDDIIVSGYPDYK